MSNTAVTSWPPCRPRAALRYRAATLEDCQRLFSELREQDRIELALSSGDSTVGVLLKSFEASDEAWAAVDETGKVIGLFGVGSVPDAAPKVLGVPWMVACDAVDGFQKELLKDGREWVRLVQSKYELLYNFVHSESSASQSWVRELGFTVDRLVPDYGAGKAPFNLIFIKGTSHV